MTDKSEEVEMTAEVADPAKALAEAQAQADKYLDMARRLQADFDNYRKRTQRENEEFRKYACSSIVGDLLTVVDDLDRASPTGSGRSPQTGGSTPSTTRPCAPWTGTRTASSQRSSRRDTRSMEKC